MRSTMQQTPLLISQMLEYGATAFPDSQVVTWTGQEPRRTSFAELRDDCARLANALRRLGIDGDQRVATFMWNNEEHLELYLAVPSTGAVLHALNIRLFPEQLVYVANHAEDKVVVVDNTLAAPFAKLLPHLTTDRARRGQRSGRRRHPRGARRRRPRRCTTTGRCSTPRSRCSPGPSWTRTSARPCATRPAPRATPRASSTRTARTTCTRSRSRWPARSAWSRRTCSSRSSRCSTPTPGACRTRRCSAARRWSCPTASCSPSRWPR